MPQFGKRTVLTRQHFADVRGRLRRRSARRPREPGQAPGHRRGRPLPPLHPRVRSPSAATTSISPGSRTRDGDNSDELPEPAVLAQEAMVELEGALEELRGILAELGEEIEEVRRRDDGQLAGALVDRMLARRLECLWFYGTKRRPIERCPDVEHRVLGARGHCKGHIEDVHRVTFAQRQIDRCAKNRCLGWRRLCSESYVLYLNKPLVRADEHGYCTTDISPSRLPPADRGRICFSIGSRAPHSLITITSD